MNIINVFALRGLVKPLFCLTSPLSNVAMLLRLDNSNLLSLEFSLWLCSKGTIWPSFVVPNAFFVVAMGPDFRAGLPNVEEQPYPLSLLQSGTCWVQVENIPLAVCSSAALCCPVTCLTLWLSDNGNKPSDIWQVT